MSLTCSSAGSSDVSRLTAAVSWSGGVTRWWWAALWAASRPGYGLSGVIGHGSSGTPAGRPPEEPGPPPAEETVGPSSIPAVGGADGRCEGTAAYRLWKVQSGGVGAARGADNKFVLGGAYELQMSHRQRL